MIARSLFDHEHEEFRSSARRFLAEECAPCLEQWEADHRVPRSIWERAGALGMLNATTPEAYGGHGLDRRFSMIATEEIYRAGQASGLIGFGVHDIVAGYLVNFGSELQKQAWLPKMAAGEAIGAVAMTEPDTGSDLQAVKTRPVLEGDDFVINGSKTFISNGSNCNVVVVAGAGRRAADQPGRQGAAPQGAGEVLEGPGAADFLNEPARERQRVHPDRARYR